MENDEDELKRLIDLYCHRLSNLRQFVSIMQEEKSPLLREILIYVMQGEKGIKTKNWAFEKWLDEEHDLTIKSELLIDFIVKENREDLLTQLKDASGSNWPSNYEKVVGRLVKESRFDLLLSSFVFNKDDKRIIELLKNTDDRSLLLSSADYVYRIDPGFVNARLQEIIRRHLDAHVGHQSADLVLDIFTQLERLQLYRLVDHLFKMILKEYPERKHLIKYIRETAV